MRKRKQRVAALVLDPQRIKMNLVCVDDCSSDAFIRSMEVVEVAANVIRLASKRGRVKQETEACDEEKAA